MSCQSISDLLPLLIYDELDVGEAAACRQHLAECADCRAELASLERTRDLLDQAPVHQSQLDLAAVCLRVAARERHSRSVRRVSVSVAAIAAVLLLALSLRFFNFTLEPGRLVVAWTKPAVRFVPAPGTLPVDVAPASLADNDAPGDDHRNRASRDADIDAYLSGETYSLVASAGLPRPLSAAQAKALRYAQPAGKSSGLTTPEKTYQDLRREYLETPVDRSVPRG
jgi:hypothetical protein